MISWHVLCRIICLLLVFFDDNQPISSERIFLGQVITMVSAGFFVLMILTYAPKALCRPTYSKHIQFGFGLILATAMFVHDGLTAIGISNHMIPTYELVIAPMKRQVPTLYHAIPGLLLWSGLGLSGYILGRFMITGK